MIASAVPNFEAKIDGADFILFSSFVCSLFIKSMRSAKSLTKAVNWD